MAGLATAPTSSTERAAATPVTGLPTDGTVGGLTTIPGTAIEASDTDITGNILGQGDLHKTAAIAQAREPRVLTPLDRMNLPKGGEEGTNGIIWDLERAIPEIHQTGRSVGTGQAEWNITK